MSFDPAHLVIGFIFSGIGFVYFQYGRKQAAIGQTLAGFALMGYPYFVTSIPLLIGIGLALAAVGWYFR